MTRPSPPGEASVTGPARPLGPGWITRGGGLRSVLAPIAARGVRDPSSALLTAQLVVAAVAFLANVLAARALAPTGRGELALLLQIGYLASLGLLLGTDRSVVVVYSGERLHVVTRAYMRLLGLPSGLGLLLVVAVFSWPGPWLGSWQTRLALAILFAVVNAFVRAIRSIAIAAGRQLDYLGCTVLSQSLLLISLATLLLARVDDVTLWLLAYLVTGALPTAVYMLLWIRPAADQVGTVDAIDGGRSDADRRRAGRREGLSLFPAAVANTGTLRLDRLLLAGMASTAALGVYASVATMTELLFWPMLAFADSRLGRWREAHDRGQLTLRRILLVTAAYGLVAGVVWGVLLRALVVPILGAQYRPAVSLVAPLIAAAVVFGAAQILVAGLTARRRNGLASLTEAVGFGVSVVAYLVLIPAQGAMGAAPALDRIRRRTAVRRGCLDPHRRSLWRLEPPAVGPGSVEGALRARFVAVRRIVDRRREGRRRRGRRR